MVSGTHVTGNDAREHHYAFTVSDTPQWIEFDLCNSSFDVYLRIFAMNGNQARQIAARDDGGCDNPSMTVIARAYPPGEHVTNLFFYFDPLSSAFPLPSCSYLDCTLTYHLSWAMASTISC